MPTVGDLRAAADDATAKLTRAGVDSPRWDAVELLGHLLGLPRSEVHRALVLGAVMTPDQARNFADLVEQRAQRRPLQHLTGRADFFGSQLAVGPGVFVPRVETELLVSVALVALQAVDRPRVVDLCTGSGAIAHALAEQRADAQVRAVELDPVAASWATRNLADKATLILGDATDPDLPALRDWRGLVDLVVANPPYVPQNAPVDQPEAACDPPLALYGGSPDGLAIPLAVIETAAALLRGGGGLLLEHAPHQSKALRVSVCDDARWRQVVDLSDLLQRPRVLQATRASAGVSAASA